MGDVVPFRRFKVNRDRMVNDVVLLWESEEEIYVEFQMNSTEAKVENRLYRKINGERCRFWGLVNDTR